MYDEDLGPEQQQDIKNELARHWRARQQAKATAQSKAGSQAQAVKNAANRYKQIRNTLRVAKIGTGVSGAGLALTVLMAHGEWIYHKFNNKYPFTKLDKILTLAADGVIVAALVLLMFIAYLQTHPLEAAKIGWKLLDI